MSDSKIQLKDLVGIFERYLLDTTRYQITPIELYQPMRYSLDSGGKRLRPSLLLAVLACQGIDNVQKGLATGLALEYVHTYSLIHDDLPAMDDDDLRRGRPTNHIVYGEDMAILAGDALLTDAFSLISEDLSLTDGQKVDLITGLSKAAGSTGMVMGQVYDLLGENDPKSVTLQDLERTHYLKTGQLFKFALQAGAIILDLAEEERDLLDKFGDYFGLAYQIHNDLMDVIGDEEETGKISNQDTAQNKATYPSLLGVEGAKEELAKNIDYARSTIDRLTLTTAKDYSIFNEFLEYLVISNG